MNLNMSCGVASGYKSGAQIARRVTEFWGCENLYCASCDNPKISASPCNTKATDFVCSQCDARYQLKAGKGWSEHRVPDAAYGAMIDAIRNDRTPNLLVMQYTPQWAVRQLMLVPSFFFSEAAVEKRKPLAPTARRAGWVGCNILLSAIAPEGKIRIVTDGTASSPTSVRRDYEKLKPLSSIPASVRGWALDVLRIVRGLDSRQFELKDVYAFEGSLAALHPGNSNIRPKIRQQLQVLRDLGLLKFLGAGKYIISSPM